MKRELKDKWVKALRSGEYKQGTTMLRSAKDEFCCLGVLCEVMGNKPTGRLSDRARIFEGLPLTYLDAYTYDNEVGFLTDNLMHEMGLSLKDMRELVHMNDKGYPFGKIANWIELNISVEEDS